MSAVNLPNVNSLALDLVALTKKMTSLFELNGLKKMEDLNNIPKEKSDMLLDIIEEFRKQFIVWLRNFQKIENTDYKINAFKTITNAMKSTTRYDYSFSSRDEHRVLGTVTLSNERSNKEFNIVIYR